MLISRIRKKTKYIIWGFVITFFISIFFMYGMDIGGGVGGNPKSAADKKSSVPNVMMKVDDRKIDMQLFYYKYLQMKRQYEMYGNAGIFSSYPMQKYLEAQIVEFIVNQEVLLQEAKKRGVSADSAEIGKRIKMQVDAYIGSGTKLDEPSVQARAKNFFNEKEREKQFRQILTRQGITFELFKKDIRRDVTQEKMGKMIGDEMLKEEKKAVREKSMSILEKIKTGEPFENLAREFSEDESSKENGGMIGWTNRGMLMEEYENAAFSMKEGGISEPVETRAGFHIIQLISKIEAVGEEFEAKKQEIISEIRLEKGDETAEISAEEIKKAYEKINTRHILVKARTSEQLAGEWVKKQREKGTLKVEIVNPELKAYKYLNRQMFDQAAVEPDLDEALKLYEKAIEVDPNNYYLYYQLGTVYEQKNEKTLIKTILENAEPTEDDPYASALAEVSDNKDVIGEASAQAPEEGVETVEDAAESVEDDPEEIEEDKTAAVLAKVEKDKNIFKKEALEAYLNAVKISEIDYRYDTMLYLAAGRVAKELDKRKVAQDNYIQAIEYSAADKGQLNEIIGALSDYDDEAVKKALVEANELVAEIEAAEAEQSALNEPLQIDMGEKELILEEPEAEDGATTEEGLDIDTDEVPIKISQ